MKFTSGMQPVAKDFSLMQKEIEDSLRRGKESSYGAVTDGLKLTFDGSKLKVTAGYGYTRSGDYVELKKDIEINIYSDSIDYYITLRVGSSKVRENVSLSDVDGKQLYSGYLELYNTVEHEVISRRKASDPYKDSLFTSDTYKTHLVIGLLRDGRVIELNRACNEPLVPVGTVFPYYGEFQDYITIRGCRLDRRYVGKYLRLSSSSGATGGRLSTKLRASNIPTLKIWNDFSTSSDGAHRHEYSTFVSSTGGTSSEKAKNAVTGHAYDKKGTWYGPAEYTETTEGGEHSHTVSARHIKSSPDSFNIEPEYITLLPILREY